jgi:8-oxo-dGTP pyrophosphatase MutT (NUDIX family)
MFFRFGDVGADPMGETELPVRQAGRVIVLDPGDRVLLFRYEDRNGRHWSTPGGGLDPGEDYCTAAQRELIEETGWTDVPVRPGEVLDRWLTMEYGDRLIRQHEQFFLARVSVDQRPLGDVAAWHRRDGIREARWWTVAELDSTDEVMWPEQLADLVRGLSGPEDDAGQISLPQ